MCWGNKLTGVIRHTGQKFQTRSDFYIRFLQSRTVDLEFTYSLTFMEGRMYNEANA